MASVINIGADNASDQFYRYKMPKLQARVSLDSIAIACQRAGATLEESTYHSTGVFPDSFKWMMDLCGYNAIESDLQCIELPRECIVTTKGIFDGTHRMTLCRSRGAATALRPML